MVGGRWVQRTCATVGTQGRRGQVSDSPLSSLCRHPASYKSSLTLPYYFPLCFQVSHSLCLSFASSLFSLCIQLTTRIPPLSPSLCRSHTLISHYTAHIHFYITILSISSPPSPSFPPSGNNALRLDLSSLLSLKAKQATIYEALRCVSRGNQ